MRIDRTGIAVEEGLEHVLALDLVHGALVGGVALVQGRAYLGRLLAGQLQAQPVVHHRLAPQAVQFGFVARPRRFLAVVLPALVAGEVEILLQQRACVSNALADALAVHREDVVGGGQVAAPDRIAQLGAVGVEAGHVGLGEVLLAAVQRLEVAVKHLARQGVVQRTRPVGVAAVGQQAVDQLGGGRLVGGWCCEGGAVGARQ